MNCMPRKPTNLRAKFNETVSINSHFQLTESHARCILEIGSQSGLETLGPFFQITVEVPKPALILGNDGWLHPINTLRHILQPGEGIPKSLKVLVNVGIIRTDYGSSPSCPALGWTACSSGPSSVALTFRRTPRTNTRTNYRGV